MAHVKPRLRLGFGLRLASLFILETVRFLNGALGDVVEGYVMEGKAEAMCHIRVFEKGYRQLQYQENIVLCFSALDGLFLFCFSKLGLVSPKASKG